MHAHSDRGYVRSRARARAISFPLLTRTTGDSAASLAIAGLAVVGREKVGVFPLKGKPLNVREAKAAQEAANAEICAIRQIMGLVHKRVYTKENIGTLRYGQIWIMADQDADGDHIVGLVVDHIETRWPSLARMPGFLRRFITPIVKVTRGPTTRAFYSLPEYEAFKATPAYAGFASKYYKGLGTSTAAEARMYFSDLPKHVVPLVHGGDECSAALTLAFDKKRADERKAWLASIDPRTTYLDYQRRPVTIKRFIDEALVLFSHADCVRSIPSMYDGLKPSQRKVLCTAFLRNLVAELKVSEFAGAVSEKTAYHHGEASLFATIIGMAQDFVGANNVPLLVPCGQFGTRIAGGSDAASSRYVFTRLSAAARLVFPAADDALLDVQHDDGKQIEPRAFLGVIPFALVNGIGGIATGWSTQVPAYHPRAVCARVRAKLDEAEGKEAATALPPLVPWQRGFTGTIEPDASREGRFTVRGRVARVGAEDSRVYAVKELPIGVWTQNYKAFIEELLVGSAEKKEAPLVADYVEEHGDDTVRFVVTLNAEGKRRLSEEGALSFFKLETTLTTSNLTLFDAEHKIKRYATPEQIVDEYYPLRLALYKKRRLRAIRELRREHARIEQRARFVRAVVDGTLVLTGKTRPELLATLLEHGFAPAEASDGIGVGTNAAANVAPKLADFDFLLSMPLWSVTSEKVERLEAELAATQLALDTARASTPASLWRADLAALEAVLTDEAGYAYAEEKRVAKKRAREEEEGGEKVARLD